MEVYLKLNSKKIYNRICKELNIISSKNDDEKSVIIDVYDKWTAGQIINALHLSIIEYKFYNKQKRTT